MEGSVGSGTGTVAFGFKGGIGTSSRKLPQDLGGYTVGVLVQANFGGVLQIDGIPVAEELETYPHKDEIKNDDGSCMIVVATDAPLDQRNLKRLAKRAMLGLARTGGYASNGSGDYVIAFSTFSDNFDTYKPAAKDPVIRIQLPNELISPLFLATVESTEEAILNALFMASIPDGFGNRGIETLPFEKIRLLISEHRSSKH
jgi:D-aminopeptidase